MDPQPARPATAFRLLLRPHALAAGFEDAEIRRLLRRGNWASLQRGAYLVGPPEPDRRHRHLLEVRATLAGLRTPAVVSHGSAAALHDLPLWQVPLDRVHVTRRPPARSARESRLRSHVARLSDVDVVLIDRIAVTSPARTVIDLALELPYPPALVVADDALRSGRVTRAELLDVLARCSGTRGSRNAGRVVAAADGRSESVGESRSRALIIESGLPRPDLQVEVRCPGGGLVGRSDFGWPGHRLLGEFDGRVKYGRCCVLGRTQGTPSSRRSGGRTRCGTRAGAWCGGSGPTWRHRQRSPSDWPARSSGAPGDRSRPRPALHALRMQCTSWTPCTAAGRRAMRGGWVRAAGPPASR